MERSLVRDHSFKDEEEDMNKTKSTTLTLNRGGCSTLGSISLENQRGWGTEHAASLVHLGLVAPLKSLGSCSLPPLG